MTKFMNYLSTFIPSPKSDWYETEEYLEVTEAVDQILEMFQEEYDILLSSGWPGTQVTWAIPLAAGLVVVPMYWVISGATYSVYDLAFGFWLTKIMPIFSLTILGFGVPIPSGMLTYLVTRDMLVPLIGDGTLKDKMGENLPHSGNPTKFGGYTDGRFTFKDLYHDMFLCWLVYKIGRNFGSAVLAILWRVIIWSAEKRRAKVTDVLHRVRDMSVTLDKTTGYKIQEGEKTVYEIMEDSIETNEAWRQYIELFTLWLQNPSKFSKPIPPS